MPMCQQLKADLEQAPDELATGPLSACGRAHAGIPRKEPEFGLVPERPLEVVHQRPVHDTAHVQPVRNRRL